MILKNSLEKIARTSGETIVKHYSRSAVQLPSGHTSIFNGTILAQVSITIATGAALNGRALARTGAVTLDSNTLVNPGAPITTPTPTTLSAVN